MVYGFLFRNFSSNVSISIYFNLKSKPTNFQYIQNFSNSRYDPRLKDSVSGKERKVRFKTFHKLLGLVTYLDWCMIIITTLTTVSMMFETPTYRVMDNTILQIMDYTFVIAMGAELSMKILAEGLLFTPKALVKDVSGFLDIIAFIGKIYNHTDGSKTLQ